MSAQLWRTLCNPMDCSPPASSVHGIFQARILELVAISDSKGSSQGLNSCLLCLLHWQVGPSPLAPPGKQPCWLEKLQQEPHVQTISLPGESRPSRLTPRVEHRTRQRAHPTLRGSRQWMTTVPRIKCIFCFIQIRSDQISRSVVSDSVWPHEPQHAIN